MAKKNDRRKQPPPPPPLSQPSFNVPPAPTVNNPPPSVSVSDAKGKGKAKTREQTTGSTSLAETTPQLLNPLSVRFQAPVRWVYNYDHTDPLNFGFMSPVESASSIDRFTLNTYPVRSSLSPTASVSTSTSTGNPKFDQVQSTPSFVRGQRAWDLTYPPAEGGQQQLASSIQHNLAGTSYQDQPPMQQNIPYRYSPHLTVSATAPTQRFVVPSEEQIWQVSQLA